MEQPKNYEVGYYYFYCDPHPNFCSYIVYSTKEQALKFINEKLDEQPSFIKDVVTRDLNSNVRDKIFLREAKVTDLTKYYK